MKSWLNLSLILLSTFAFTTLVQGAGNKGNADKGKAVYSSRCSSCHGARGEGNPAMAKVFKVEMRALGSKAVQAQSDEELGKKITEGSGKMRPLKLNDEEVANVIAYVRTLAKK